MALPCHFISTCSVRLQGYAGDDSIGQKQPRPGKGRLQAARCQKESLQQGTGLLLEHGDPERILSSCHCKPPQFREIPEEGLTPQVEGILKD